MRLVGKTIEAFRPTQLPIRRECLQRLFHLEEIEVGVFSIRRLASKVADEALALYAAATLTTVRPDKATDVII